MLFRNGQKDPRVIIKAGMVLLLFFFMMKLLPHPASRFGDGLFDGIHGTFLGAATGLLLWGAYLNGKARRSTK